MSQKYEIVPAYSQEGEQVVWSPKVQEQLVKSALDYHSQHRDMFPNFTDGGFEMAGRVIQQAFMDGLPGQKSLPQTVGSVKATLRTGFEIRQYFLNEYHQLEQQSQGIIADYGMSREEQSAAQQEYYNQHTLAQFPEMRAFTAKFRQRMIDVPIVAEALLTSIAETTGIIDPQQVTTIIPDITSQAMIIRGAVLGALGRGWGVQNINSAFLTDDRIDQLLPHLDTVANRNELGIVADFLTKAQDIPVDTERMKKIFMDYGEQALDVLTRWSKVKREHELTQGSVRYWELRSNILRSLPTNSFSPDVQFVFTKDALAYAQNEKIPHLWSDTNTIDGRVFPTAERIESGLGLMLVGGYPISDSGVVRLRRAHDAYQTYYGAIQRTTQRMDSEEQKMQRAQSYVEENAFLEYVIIDEPPILSARLRRVSSYLNLYTRTRNNQQHTKDILDEMKMLHEQSTPQSRTVEKIALIKNKNTQDLNAMNGAVRRHEERLLAESWRGFYNQKFEGGYTDPQRLTLELDTVNQYIAELEENVRQTFPEDFLKDPEALSTFITNSLQSIMRSYRTLMNPSEKAHIIARGVSCAKEKHFKWKAFRELVLSGFKMDRQNIMRMQRSLTKQDGMANAVALVSDYETSGVIDPALQIMIDEVQLTSLEAYIRGLELSLFPNDLMPMVNEETLQEARQLLRTFDRARNSMRFVYPSPETLNELVSTLIQSEEQKKNRTRIITAYQTVEPMSHHPLFPQDSASGLRFSTLIDCFHKRVAYAEALLNEDQYRQDHEQLKELVALSRQKKEWREKRTEMIEARSQVQYFQNEQVFQRAKLANVLQMLDLGFTPEEFESVFGQQ